MSKITAGMEQIHDLNSAEWNEGARAVKQLGTDTVPVAGLNDQMKIAQISAAAMHK